MTETRNEWIEKDAQRAAFWATSNDLGLSEEETRIALGIGPDGSTREYEGTLDDALEAVAEFADGKRSVAAAGAVSEMGEPPYVMFSQALSKKGWEISFTVRGVEMQDTLDDFARMIRKLESWGCRPLVNSRYDLTLFDGQQSVPVDSPSARSAHPARQQASRDAGPDYERVGDGRIEEIEVKPSGQVLISVDKLEYPLKDSRGAEVVAGLFDDSCWTPDFGAEKLSEPGWYHPPGLTVTYGKNKRGYWDIISVSGA